MAFNREAHIIQQAVKGPKMTIVKQLKKQLSIVKVSLGQFDTRYISPQSFHVA